MAFRPLIVIRRIPNIDFMGLRKFGFALSLFMTVGSIGLFAVNGLNYGIDFSGGIVIEARTPGAAHLAEMRTKLDSLGIGQVQLQGVGGANDVMIRVQRQPGGDAAQEQAVTKVKQALGLGMDYLSTNVVGPTIGAELIRDGTIATILALVAIAIYVWFRFEWQFGIGAMLSTLHDTITTVGLFALLRVEFNLTTLAAILTIAGYSINDTVVIYDRVRETMRRHKTMDFSTLINKSLNETLSRTILTVSTTALAVLSLFFFGGQVLHGFSIAMLWGIVVGTYSSLFIAAPMLYYIRPKGVHGRGGAAVSAPAPAAAPEKKREKTGAP
jgi:preprotein translocase subunit SecF